jgi:ectoine hydroxylase-related dioxygenase (phytanoyl-CoA dioxygenase family)
VHWDWNPWIQTAAEAAGAPEVYQGLIALVDCPEEVGGFLAVAGSTNYTRDWVKDHKPYSNENIIVRQNPEFCCPASISLSDLIDLLSCIDQIESSRLDEQVRGLRIPVFHFFLMPID